MESLPETESNVAALKTSQVDEAKEDGMKINGEVNGSYEEQMDVEDSCRGENGEVRTEPSDSSEPVPSHENGLGSEERMDVDSEEPSAEETRNNNGDASEDGYRDTDCGPIDECQVEEEGIEGEDKNGEGELLEEEDPYEGRGDEEDDDEEFRGDAQHFLQQVGDNGDNIQPEDDDEEPVIISEEFPSKKEDQDIDEMDEEDLPKEVQEIRKKDSIEITLVRNPGKNKEPEAVPLNMSLKEVNKKLEKNEAIIVNSSQGEVQVLKTSIKIGDDDNSLEITTDRSKKKPSSPQALSISPRRSSRNLSKSSKPFSDKEYEDDGNSESDIEEVIPEDPLADVGRTPRKTTIVVNDTKRLVEIAAGSKQSRGGKKEPTLVIIDTKSILSGKGPVPVSQATLPQMTITPAPPRGSSFSMVPVNTPPQSFSKQPKPIAPVPVQPPAPKPQVVLPSLTDDMYVVEAPSFIVPYVYEKPPVTALKEYIDDLEKVIKEQKAKEEEERKRRKKEKELEKQKEKEEEKEEKEDDISKDGSEKEEKEKKESEKSDSETEEDKESDEEKEDTDDPTEKTKKKSESYFDNPLGKFFIQIGVNLVQEYVQTDLLRNQKKKRDREGKNCAPEVHMAISSLLKTLECSKENNEPFKLELKKCTLCSFKTESELVMAHHLETPHMRNYVYRCNFCTMEVRSPHDILFHMEALHNVRGRLERAPAFHQCPNCPFEDNQKGKLSRHLLSCVKKYKPERNQEPPLDWEPPAKIPRVRGARPGLGMAGAIYPPVPRGVHAAALTTGRMPSPPATAASLLAHRGRGRPPALLVNRYIGDVRISQHQKVLNQQAARPGNMMYRPTSTNSQPQVLLPNPYQISNSQLFQNKVGGAATAKLLQQPSISITPLPRQPQSNSTNSPQAPSGSSQAIPKPGRPPGSSKTSFVICEICDGYIKDLEQLRNHMQWIHKVKIHPKMIYNRPPLNCQKCQLRFFTDQGLERHLLGSHGLVTSSMQEAANKGKDGGRCPVCGRVYQWKLLNHVARDHSMSLKPAHLSYKCTVCTATFGMYKQFESHVYSAHSVVAKRVMDKKPAPPQQPSTSSSSESLLKPLKINDEITIIPQPARTKTKPPPQPQKTNK